MRDLRLRVLAHLRIAGSLIFSFTMSRPLNGMKAGIAEEAHMGFDRKRRRELVSLGWKWRLELIEV